jgi:hypothetical protein
MLFEEFQTLTGCDDYTVYKQFETLYMQSDMDKKDFCKAVRPVVASIMEEKRQEKIRLVRIRINQCFNGNDIYNVYVLKDYNVANGRAVIQFTGFSGIGCADFSRPYEIEPGRAELTRAERKELSTWDVHEICL